jgi:signal transduction histidine kinase
MALGLVGLIGWSKRGRGSFIDACIISTSAGLVAWVFLMAPYATDLSLTVAERLVSVAYPMGDLLLLATVIWFFLTEGFRNRSLHWLFVSTAALLISDTGYGFQVLQGEYSAGWTDSGFMISYLAFAAAGLEPAMGQLRSKGGSALLTISRRRLALLAGAAVLGPLLGLTALQGNQVDLWVMTGGTLVLFLLTFLRIAGLMRSVEHHSSLLQLQGRELESAVTDLKDLEVARRHLLEAIHSASEKERSSLAVELHDGPIQHLTTLSFEVDLATTGLDRGDGVVTRDALEVLESGLSDEIENLRVLMTDLRPPVLDERGLSEALDDYVSGFRARTGILCELDLHVEVRLARADKTMLYRVAQEALTNVAKHSGALNVLVACRTIDGRAEMEITDDGAGFELSTTNLSGMDGHLGLASIKERIEFAGGTCSIVSAVGAGTQVAVSLDIEGESDAEITRLAS